MFVYIYWWANGGQTTIPRRSRSAAVFPRRRAADCHYKSLKLRNRVEADETSVGQHTDVDVPHFEAEDFNFIKGAFMSIDRWVPSVA